MSDQDNILEIEPVDEIMDENDEFVIDAALNALAMNTLTFMNEEVNKNEQLNPADHAYIMLHATEAVMFNIIMHIADNAGVDALELAEKTKENLMEAIKSMGHHGDGCCDHHH